MVISREKADADSPEARTLRNDAFCMKVRFYIFHTTLSWWVLVLIDVSHAPPHPPSPSFSFLLSCSPALLLSLARSQKPMVLEGSWAQVRQLLLSGASKPMVFVTFLVIHRGANRLKQETIIPMHVGRNAFILNP